MKNSFSKLLPKNKKGFTLIEVLVVIVILAVLAAIAIPTYQKLIRKSRVADGLHVLDMLATAQHKYFIEHGQYASNIIELNVPLKGYGPSQDQNIRTTNFTYEKPNSKNCLRAIANVGGNYILVKNYQTNEPILCIGPDCNMVSDYVAEIPESGYDDLCPDIPDTPGSQQCELNSESCSPKIFNAADCICECEAGAQEACEVQGGTYNSTSCACIIGENSACLETLPSDIVEQCFVSNPEDECGTKTTHYICNETTGWHVQAQVSDCVIQTKPEGAPPYEITSDGCLKREQTWVCDSSGWTAVPTLGNWLSNGTVSVNIGGLLSPQVINYDKNCTNDSGGYDLNGQLLGEDVWCENCLKRTCPDGAVRNVNNKKCYKPDTDFKLFIIGSYADVPLVPMPWCGSNCFCRMPSSPTELTIACKHNSNGQYLPTYEELGCPPGNGISVHNVNFGSFDYDGIDHCAGEGRKIIQVAQDDIINKIRYCKQAPVSALDKVATSANLNSYSDKIFGEGYYSDNPTWHSCWGGFSSGGGTLYYYCDPYPLNISGSNIVACGEVVSLIVQ